MAEIEFRPGLYVRVKLHDGRTMDAVVRNVIKDVTGTKLQVAFDDQSTWVDVGQVIEVFESPYLRPRTRPE